MGVWISLRHRFALCQLPALTETKQNLTQISCCSRAEKMKSLAHSKQTSGVLDGVFTPRFCPQGSGCLKGALLESMVRELRAGSAFQAPHCLRLIVRGWKHKQRTNIWRCGATVGFIYNCRVLSFVHVNVGDVLDFPSWPRYNMELWNSDCWFKKCWPCSFWTDLNSLECLIATDGLRTTRNVFLHSLDMSIKTSKEE